MGNTAENKRFQVLNDKFGNKQLLKLYDSKTKEFVSILPETGGMLLSMEMFLNNKLVSIFETYNTEKELIDTLGNSFKGSNLHPYPNRIDAGKYSFEGKNYQLPVNFPHENNAIHGLIYDKPFKVIETLEGNNSASIKLEYSAEKSGEGYPFSHTLTVVFVLDNKKGLTVTSKITNTDKVNIPVGNGWHPYFTLESKVDDLLFSFPAIELFEVNARMLPTEKKENYNKYRELRKIGSDSFDSCFGLKDQKGIAEIVIKDPALNSGITVWQETGENKYNFLQIYTPEHRKSIAIEPMTCAPNALNNKFGLISLKPKQSVEFSWGVNKIA